MNIALEPHITNVRFDIGLSWGAPNLVSWAYHRDNCALIGIEPQHENYTVCNELLYMKVLSQETVDNILTFYNTLHNQEQPKQNVFPFEYSRIPNIKNIRLIKVAIDDVEQFTKKKFYCTQHDLGCSSLYKPTSTFSETTFESEVLVINFREILKSLFELNPQIEYVEYIKIDTQGSDLNVLRSAKELLSKIAMIQVESTTHDHYHDTPADGEIEEFLESQQFAFLRAADNSVVNNVVVDKIYINKNFLHLIDEIPIIPINDNRIFVIKNKGHKYLHLKYLFLDPWTMAKHTFIEKGLYKDARDPDKKIHITDIIHLSDGQIRLQQRLNNVREDW